MTVLDEPIATVIAIPAGIGRATLVGRAMDGDESAFDLLVSPQLGRMLRLAGSILASESDGADVVQDACLAAWRRLPTLRDPDLFDAWLSRILVNGCRDALRRRTRRRVREIPTGEMDIEREPSRDRPIADAVTSDMAVRRAFARLKADDRMILALHHVDDRPVAEIATLLGMPEGTAKWRLSACPAGPRAGHGGRAMTFERNRQPEDSLRASIVIEPSDRSIDVARGRLMAAIAEAPQDQRPWFRKPWVRDIPTHRLRPQARPGIHASARLAVVLLVVLAVLLATLLAIGSRRTDLALPRADNGLIAFVGVARVAGELDLETHGTRVKRTDLYTVRQDGTGLRQLTRHQSGKSGRPSRPMAPGWPSGARQSPGTPLGGDHGRSDRCRAGRGGGPCRRGLHG